ncbi:beta-phosphoglucomutase [Pinirhizobacter soli]|uniref:beta-phosphoglucomutase n=1 Tax=Pinirhizobacter soli TaxID=2786953 RepID=UPI00202A3C3D
MPISATAPLAEIPSAGKCDPWVLRRQGTDPSAFAQEESLFAVANGALGVRGGLEEGGNHSQRSFIAGIWERSPIHYHERFSGFARHTDTRVPVADGTAIRLRLGDTLVDLAQGQWLDFTRELDMRRGVFRRTLRWRSASGQTLDIIAERLAALDEPGLLAMRYQVISVDYQGPITLESSIDAGKAPVEQGDDPRIGAQIEGGLHLVDAHADERSAWVMQRTTHSDISLVCAQRHRVIEGDLAIGACKSTPRGVVQVFSGTLAPGQGVSIEKNVGYAWTDPGHGSAAERLHALAEAVLDRAGAMGFPALLVQQTGTLERFWNEVDLGCDDALVEQSLRFNLFHLYQSSGRDSSGSTAAKGLTGEGYEGHYFWDTEVFMLPALAPVAPEIARNMLAYRYRTLDRARAHAREMDHASGALYAWRTISGDECSSYFPSGSAQYHINAAVAWAVRHYWDVSGDDGFMLDEGAEILFETARVWRDVGHFSDRHDGAFCIHEVTGPDEYSALVNNNFYTNRMAQRHLADAAGTARWMAQAHPERFDALAARLCLTDFEVAQWRQAAAMMYLPTDAALDIYPQDDGFLDKPRLPANFQDHTNKQPLLLRLHPLTIYRYQVCKQADALLALMLAGEHVGVAAKRRNFDYYEGVTVHDSTLSASTFAVMAAEVGHADKAYDYFLDTLRVDLDDLHGNAAHGVHMAAMAGSQLALTWGFGGLRVRHGKPWLAPQLPKAWNYYRFGLHWQGCHLRVEVDATGVLYTLTRGEHLAFAHGGVPQTLQAGQSVRLALPALPAPAPALARPLKAVIFDLDGVIADTAVVHDAAWKRLAGEIGVSFGEGMGERLKGVDRMGSLDILLENAGRAFSMEEKFALAERKNDYYKAQVQVMGPHDLLPGARQAIEAARRQGLKVGLASASRNAPLLLDRLGIAKLFDHVVDAGLIGHSKPHPEIFLSAANALGVDPQECLGVEDAAAGIASILAAGMAAVGIGQPHVLADAHVVLSSVAELDLSFIKHIRREESATSASPAI